MPALVKLVHLLQQGVASDRIHKSNSEHFFDLGVNLDICSAAYSCLPLNEILHSVAPCPDRGHNHAVFPQLLHPSHKSVPALANACFIKCTSCIAIEEK